MHEEPGSNPRISHEERAYIEMNTEVKQKGSQSVLPPIKDIFTSVPVLALFTAQALNNYGFATLMNGIPTYLNDVQGLPIDKNGIATSLPYAAWGLMGLPVGYLSDKLVNSGKVSLSTARKIYQCTGVTFPAPGLIWLSFIGCDTVMAIIAICVCMATNAFIYSGMYLSFADLSPNYSASLFAI